MEALQSKNVALQRQCAALTEYVKVLERDTELLRCGDVVPKDVVSALEDYFATKEAEARKVPDLEAELAKAEQQIATWRQRAQTAEQEAQSAMQRLQKAEAQLASVQVAASMIHPP